MDIIKQIVRFPLELETDNKGLLQLSKALDIYCKHGWDNGIDYCCRNKDNDSLASFPLIKNITDFFISGDLPTFTIGEIANKK